MKFSPIQSGYFEHTRQAKSDRAVAKDNPKSRPWVAPRVALDVLLLPMNLTLGTVANYIEKDDSCKIFHLQNGKPLTAVQLGALGLVNKSIGYGFGKLFQGLGVTAGVVTTPIALLAGKKCGAYIHQAGAYGAQIGASIGYIVGSVGEFTRAAGRWIITHPHQTLAFLMMLVIVILIIAAVDKGFEKVGVSDPLARSLLTSTLIDKAIKKDPPHKPSDSVEKLSVTEKETALDHDADEVVNRVSEPLLPTSVEFPETNNKAELSDSAHSAIKRIALHKEEGNDQNDISHERLRIKSPTLTATIPELPDSDSESEGDFEQSSKKSGNHDRAIESV